MAQFPQMASKKCQMLRGWGGLDSTAHQISLFPPLFLALAQIYSKRNRPKMPTPIHSAARHNSLTLRHRHFLVKSALPIADHVQQRPDRLLQMALNFGTRRGRNCLALCTLFAREMDVVQRFHGHLCGAKKMDAILFFIGIFQNI